MFWSDKIQLLMVLENRFFSGNAHSLFNTMRMDDSKKNKGGRPRLPDNKKAKNKITFKVNNNELLQLVRYAKKAAKPKSDVIREILFDKKLTVRVINEGDSNIVLKIDEVYEQYRISVAELNRISARMEVAKDEELSEFREDLCQAIKIQESIKEQIYQINEQVNHRQTYSNVKAKDF